MAKEEKKESCCEPAECCKVEAMVSVDERGQMVLPKEIRDKVGHTARGQAGGSQYTKRRPDLLHQPD